MKVRLVFSFLLYLSFSQGISACNSSTSYLTRTICEGDSVSFYGAALTQAGTYNDTIILTGGCDSIISLQLSVIPSVYTQVSGLLCTLSKAKQNIDLNLGDGSYLVVVRKGESMRCRPLIIAK